MKRKILVIAGMIVGVCLLFLATIKGFNSYQKAQVAKAGVSFMHKLLDGDAGAAYNVTNDELSKKRSAEDFAKVVAPLKSPGANVIVISKSVNGDKGSVYGVLSKQTAESDRPVELKYTLVLSQKDGLMGMLSGEPWKVSSMAVAP